jgi:hypothetical protein
MFHIINKTGKATVRAVVFARPCECAHTHAFVQFKDRILLIACALVLDRLLEYICIYTPYAPRAR